MGIIFFYYTNNDCSYFPTEVKGCALYSISTESIFNQAIRDTETKMTTHPALIDKITSKYLLVTANTLYTEEESTKASV